MKFIFRKGTEMTDDNLKLNDELQKLWDRGQIVECCLRMQVQYDKVAEQNKQLQQELRKKTAECEELKKAAFTLAEGLNFRQKMLDEIENFAKRHCNSCEDNGQQLCSSNYCYRHYLLDIINKAKGA